MTTDLDSALSSICYSQQLQSAYWSIIVTPVGKHARFILAELGEKVGLKPSQAYNCIEL